MVSGSDAMRRRWLDGGLDQVPVAGSAGQLWLCGKHVVGADPELALQRIGGRATMVCLNQRMELEDRYPEYVSWLQEHDGGRAMWFPIPDLHAPALSTIRPFLDQAVARMESGEHLLVHCGAGVGRAGTVAVCLLMLHGLPRDDALALVASHRPMAGPEVGAQRALVDALAATR
ncbi:MAG: dual specificity protein phosphatase family protein [Ilumatobacteraceae bacterium]